MPRIIISVVLALCATSVHAEIYKCSNADGSVEFSDMPCSETAEIIGDVKTGTSGIDAFELPNSITLADGSVQPFKEIISIEVKTGTGYKTGKTGMHIFYEGTDHLVEFANLESMRVLSWDKSGCGNTGHLCNARVRIKTSEREITASYEALRNITVLLDDKLDGVEKEMTIWFGNQNKVHIRGIRF